MIRERTSAALAQARLEERLGGRRRKLGDKKCREIAESVISGRKSGAETARLYDVSERPSHGSSPNIARASGSMNCCHVQLTGYPARC